MPPLDVKIIEDNLGLILSMGIDAILAFMILVAGWMGGNWVSERIRKFKKIDETLVDFLAGLSKYTILIVAVVMMLSEFGVQTASLLAVLGAAGLAIGLALQGTLSNVAAGVMLLLLRPFKLGDYITIGNENIGGTVRSLGLFGTELSAPDNVYIFIPNSQIWTNDIWNFTRNPYRRQDINVGISYNDDINKAFTVIRSTIAQDQRIIQNDETMQPQVMASQMGDFSVNLIVRVWSASPDYWAVRWDLTKAIKEALDANGITIPFPTRKIEMVHSNQKNQAA